jgi:hypothetical protein
MSAFKVYYRNTVETDGEWMQYMSGRDYATFADAMRAMTTTMEADMSSDDSYDYKIVRICEEVVMTASTHFDQ